MELKDLFTSAMYKLCGTSDTTSNALSDREDLLEEFEGFLDANDVYYCVNCNTWGYPGGEPGCGGQCD